MDVETSKPSADGKAASPTNGAEPKKPAGKASLRHRFVRHR
jgi:hypothetical protein